MIEAGRRVDLLVTDVVMPGMTGIELAERARELATGVRVVYMTGYSDRAELDVIADSGDPLLTKPFTPVQLVVAMHRAARAANGPRLPSVRLRARVLRNSPVGLPICNSKRCSAPSIQNL